MVNAHSSITTLLGLSVAVWVHAGQQVRRVDDVALKNAGKTGEDWLTYGFTPGETRYSPLNQINTSNVSRLGLAWSAEIGPGGGGAVWDGMAYDPEAELVYVGTGNAEPWPEKLRKSKDAEAGKDNLYVCSILAVHVDSSVYLPIMCCGSMFFSQTNSSRWVSGIRTYCVVPNFHGLV